MGKKSKNPSKKSSKGDGSDASAVALNTLQQLQSGIDSMSLHDAFAAVKMATNSINQMKAEQQRAAADLQTARAEVERSKLDKSNNDLYADVNFWDKRYKDEAVSSSGKPTASGIYEWYLGFEELRPLLLPDIAQARQQIPSGEESEILVAGCGNSSMCEDLYHAGVHHICGMDYSQSVIEAMKQRLNTPTLAALKTKGHVRYLQADGTKMPKAMGSSCSVVVDKGTLDAITSGGVAEGQGDTANGTRAALAYMHEMWRILQPHGVFIIVSTIPPDLFHLVGSSVVPSLANEAQKGSKQQKQNTVRTGSGYRIHSFVTKEGGSVFYYALFKPSTESKAIVKTIKDSTASRATTSTATSSAPSSTEYQSLMLEAQAALKELQAAQLEVQKRAEAASLLTKDLRETEEKADRISKELDSNLSANMVNNILEEAKNEASGCSSSSGTSTSNSDSGSASLKKDIKDLEKAYLETKQAACSKSKHVPFRSSVDSSIPLTLPHFPSISDCKPEVSLVILPSSSMLQADGHVEVEFTLFGGKWDDDDFISLHHLTGEGVTAVSGTAAYDHFEYTSEPKISKSGLTGVCRIPLPSFGGPFYLSYQRTFTAITEKTLEDVKPGEEFNENDAVITRLNKALTMSDIFQVSFQVQGKWKSTGINVKCRHLQKSRDFMAIVNNDYPHSVASDCDSLTYMVEDLQSINVFALTVKWKAKGDMGTAQPSSQSSFSRVSAWISKEGSSAKKESCIISLEADCGDILNYLHMTLPEFSSAYSLLLDQASGQVTSQESKMNAKFYSSIVIRIPYQLLSQDERLSRVEMESAVNSSSDVADNGCLQCSFCCNVLTAKGSIQRRNLLPSGKFDHMMHEFLCSENPLVPLSMNDMETGKGSILVGNIYLSVNAKDVPGSGTGSAPSAVILSCKTSPSMIDTVNSEVSSSINSATDGQKPQQQMSLIDTSTCAATCARCGMYVGDGQIVDRVEEEAEEEEDAGSDDTPSKGNFALQDLSNIRFIRHRVQWQEESSSRTQSTSQEAGQTDTSASAMLRKRMSTEQVISNLLIAASNLYGSSTFELFVPDVPSMKLLIRLLSRPREHAINTSPSCGYAVYTPPESPPGSCGVFPPGPSTNTTIQNAIKISYCFASSKPSVSKAPIIFRPIAVEFADYEEVTSVLLAREMWSAPSFQPNESLGYMLL